MSCIKGGHFSWRDNLLYSDIDGQLTGAEYGIDVKRLKATKINKPLAREVLRQLEVEFEENYSSGGNDPCKLT